jgi:hypothetical protein
MKTIKFGTSEFSTLSGNYVYIASPVMGEKCLCFSAEELHAVLEMMESRAAERVAQEIAA